MVGNEKALALLAKSGSAKLISIPTPWFVSSRTN